MSMHSEMAKLHSDIWFFHDAVNYNKLFESANDFFIKIGFEKKNSIKAANHVKKSYYFYDLAVNNPNEKAKHFTKVFESHRNALIELNQDFPNICAKIHTMWWKEFYSKNKTSIVKIPFFIFLQHLLKFKKLNLFPVILCAGLLVLAGLKGHNNRDKKTTEKYLEKYWSSVLRYKSKNIAMY